MRWGGRCIYFVAGSLGYFSKIAVTLTDRLRPGQRRLALALAAGALVPYALLCYYKVEIVVVAVGRARALRIETREEEGFTLPSLFWFSLALAPSTIAGAVTTELWYDVDPSGVAGDAVHHGIPRNELGRLDLRLWMRTGTTGSGSPSGWSRWRMELPSCSSASRRRPRHRPTAWHLRRSRTSCSLRCGSTSRGARAACPCSTPSASTKFMASPLADRLWNSEDRADEPVAGRHRRRRTSRTRSNDSDDDEGEPVDMEEFSGGALLHPYCNMPF